MRNHPALCALAALLSTTIALGVAGAPRIAPPASGSQGEAETDIPLRQLAEIDGDLATFTDEEQRKFAVLQQVLGTAPVSPPIPGLTDAGQFTP